MVKIHVPEPLELGTSLSSLVGRTARVRDADTPHTYDETVHTARYLTRDNRLAALLQVDLPLAAHLGAALAMMPAAVAEDAIKQNSLDENLIDAYSEVANILAGLLCDDATPHVRWTDLETSTARLTEGDKTILEEPCQRIDLNIELDDCGSGRLTIYTAVLG